MTFRHFLIFFSVIFLGGGVEGNRMVAREMEGKLERGCPLGVIKPWREIHGVLEDGEGF